MIHIITVGFNNWNDSKECLESIFLHSPSSKIYFVNNGSLDGTKQEAPLILRDKGFYIEAPTNKGYAGGFNLGIKSAILHAKPEDLVCLINNDCVVNEGWLGTLEKAYYNCIDGEKTDRWNDIQRIGYVSPTTNYACVPSQVKKIKSEKLYWEAKEVLYKDCDCPHVCIMLDVASIKEIGLYDEELAPHGMMEDIDYNWRMRRLGFVNYIDSTTWIYHKGSKTINSIPNIHSEHIESAKRMSEKHKNWEEKGRMK